MNPQFISRYQIIRPIGQGGMGKVFLAHDPQLERDVVVKVILTQEQPSNEATQLHEPSTTHQTQTISYQRFKHEVQAAAKLNHPHIVTIYDVDLEHHPPYVVMEHLDGGTLQTRFQAGPMGWHTALTLLRPLAEALAYAHEQGVIHRDLKPSNVMFVGHTLKLVDFGLARQQGGEQLTQTGEIFGTPAYMSPEQAKGQPTNAQTDIFAFGLIVLEAMLGKNPLQKGSIISTLYAVTSNDPVEVSPLVAPAQVINMVSKAVAKDLNQRYLTSKDLLNDLDLCLKNAVTAPLEAATLISVKTSPPPAKLAPKLMFIGAGLGLISLIVVVAAVITMWWQTTPQPTQTVTQGKLLATIIGLKPEVKVEQAGSGTLQSVDFGANLYEHDVIYTRAGASVNIACQNGLIITLPEQRNLELTCQDDGSVQVVAQLDSELVGQWVGGLEQKLAATPSEKGTVRGIEENKIPLLLSPRNSIITHSNPTFQWQPVENTSGYRITISSSSGESWSQEVMTTSFTYPHDAPLLDGTYLVEIASQETLTMSDKSSLQIMSEKDRAKLVINETSFNQLEEPSRSYMLAQLYQQTGLWDAAIQRLTDLTTTSPTPKVWQQLGDIYVTVGLYTLAQESYQNALKQAKAQGDGVGQAAAYVGLAYLADPPQAIEYLTQAEALYRQANLTDLAAEVSAQKARLSQ